MGPAQGKACAGGKRHHFRCLIALSFSRASLCFVSFDVLPVYLLASVTGLCLCARDGEAGTLVATDATILPPSLCSSGPSCCHLSSGRQRQPLADFPVSPLCASSSLLPTQQPEESVRNGYWSTLLLCVESLCLPSHLGHLNCLPCGL